MGVCILTAMKGVKLSPLINYLAGEDEEGPVGVMVFMGNDKHIRKVVTIEDENDFRFYFSQFREKEERGFLINQSASIGLSD